jgi:hypothetical protein
MPPSASNDHARRPSPPALEGIARTTSRFQKREWAWQRAGWVALGLLILAGLTGVLGGGPLAEAYLHSDSNELEYQRFVRRHADATWQFTLRRGTPSGNVEIALDGTFASRFKIVGIQPEPDGVSLNGDRWTYRFVVADVDESMIVFHIQPQHIGRHEGTISVNGGAPFRLWQLAYP